MPQCMLEPVHLLPFFRHGQPHEATMAPNARMSMTALLMP